MKKIPDYKSYSKCSNCENLCCTYITVKIPAPRTILDFDGLLWQLSHKDVQAFKDSNGWYLLISNKCAHLKNGKCAIYDKRPITCREHSIEKCEKNNPISKASSIFFKNYKSLEDYCEKKFKTWRRRFKYTSFEVS